MRLSDSLAAFRRRCENSDHEQEQIRQIFAERLRGMKKAVPFLFNVLNYAAIAFLMPFLVLFYQSLGFTGIQIGVLAGMGPLITLFAAPLWTGTADARRWHRGLMSLAIASTVLLTVIFPFLRSLWPVILVWGLYSVLSAPITSFVDSATMSMLGDEKEMYGRIRLGGTLGWGLAAPLAGMLIQGFGLKLAFWGYALLMFVGLIVSQGLRYEHRGERVSIRSGLGTLLASRGWIVFLVMALISGMGLSSVNNYLFPYLKELKASETIMGVSLTISTLSEIPVLFFAHHLLKVFRPFGLLLLGMAFTGLRLLLFFPAPSPAGVLAVQTIQGLTFPLVWVAGVAYADENAPSGMRSTAQGLFGAMVFGFGSASGGFLGGLMLSAWGGRAMYLAFGLGVLASTACIATIHRLLRQPI
jgi:PPP family 3-phenylpropionic acid transporter